VVNNFEKEKPMFINGYQRSFPRPGTFKPARAGAVNVRGHNR
jgi:hypothetical protein